MLGDRELKALPKQSVDMWYNLTGKDLLKRWLIGEEKSYEIKHDDFYVGVSGAVF